VALEVAQVAQRLVERVAQLLLGDLAGSRSSASTETASPMPGEIVRRR
jgi:hypothetical protein